MMNIANEITIFIQFFMQYLVNDGDLILLKTYKESLKTMAFVSMQMKVRSICIIRKYRSITFWFK